MAFPSAGDGFYADVIHDGRHLRLFSEVTAVGEVGAVYDLNAEVWIAREWADSLEDGQRKAQEIVNRVLRVVPAIEWKRRS